MVVLNALSFFRNKAIYNVNELKLSDVFFLHGLVIRTLLETRVESLEWLFQFVGLLKADLIF